MDSICVFCGRTEASGKAAGELITKEEMTMHMSCLYFSAGLGQRMEPEEGILGFVKEDIEKELKRGRRGKCVICKKNGNFVGCAVSHCPKAGHFPCLHANNYLFQYYGTFNSFCPAHCPSQNPCPLLHQKKCFQCCICFGSLKPRSVPSFQVLYSPCCFHLVHRKCIQLQAWSAGEHFFRCPVCNDTGRFIEEMLRLGIEIPSRDASWETTGQFDDLHLQEEKCELEHCLCSKGRRSFTSSGPSRCMHCLFCGRTLGHLECLMKVVAAETTNIHEHRGGYVCEDCSPVLAMKSPAEGINRKKPKELSVVKESPQIQRNTEPVEYWEVVDLTTSPPSQESPMDTLPRPSLVGSSESSANRTVYTPSVSAPLTLAPPIIQLPPYQFEGFTVTQSESYTITLCSCGECVGRSSLQTSSSSASKDSGNVGEKDAAIVHQLLVSISTSKLASVPKTLQETGQLSRKRSRPHLT